MKKRLIYLISFLMFVFLLVPSIKAEASGYAVDYDTKETVDEITTHVITNGDDNDLDTIKSYGIAVPSDAKELIVPIKLDHKGILICTAVLDDTTPESVSAYLDIYADAECTDSIYYNSYNNIAKIPEAGTYYLKFTVYDSADVEPEYYALGFASQFYSGDDRTIKNKEWTCTGSLDYSTPVYYKISAKESGSITIEVDAEYSSNVTLLNSKKKALSEEVYVSTYSGGKTVFAVDKGTYYIKVTSSSDIYRLKSSFKETKDYSGATKAKAKTLAKGKLYSGLVTTSDKTGKIDWYKITLTKSQEVNITFTGSVSSGEIEIEFYGNEISGSITDRISSVDADGSFAAETWTSSKLPKGTYYIKVTKSSKYTSGFYNIRLDK
jgi:hypothetical protein